MTLAILYRDEFRGFARSKVMTVLWVGLPLLAIVLRLIQPDTDEIPLLTFVAILTGSIGGTLSAVFLSTTVTGERTRHVYDLFLIRPVRRSALLVSKYLAALSCLVIAVVISVVLGGLVDIVAGNGGGLFAPGVGVSMLISVVSLAIASSLGILFGVLINSVVVSAILSVYLGNQLSAIVVLPAILIDSLPLVPFVVGVGVALPTVVLLVAIAVFNRSSL